MGKCNSKSFTHIFGPKDIDALSKRCFKMLQKITMNA